MAGGASLNVLVPAAGEGSRFKRLGIETPKPLITFHRGDSPRMTMLEHSLRGFQDPKARILIGASGHYPWPTLPNLGAPYELRAVGQTQGQTHSVMALALAAGYDADSHEAVPDAPALVVNCDQGFYGDLLAKMPTFYQLPGMDTVDCIALTFRSRGDRRYSYISDAPRFRYAVEKRAISQYALAGAYWFRSTAALLDACAKQYRLGPRHNDELYLSGALEYLGGGYALEVEKKYVYGWGTPEELFSDTEVKGLDPDIHTTLEENYGYLRSGS